MDAVEIQKSGLKLTILDIESIWEQFKLSQVTLVDLSNNSFENIEFFVGSENISIFEDFVSLKTLILSGNPIKQIHPNSLKSCPLVKFEMDNSQLQKTHHFRFLKNKQTLEEICIKNHACYDLNLNEFINVVGSLKNLRILDFRRENWIKTDLTPKMLIKL